MLSITANIINKMPVFAPKKLICPITFLLLLTIQRSQAVLNDHYYDETCPQAEKIILDTVRNASMHDPKVPARILRMFFHDCFIRGCDASLLLDSTPENKAEKDGPPNISVRSFYVIDDAKVKLEMACPHTVSCADIIAVAARDVVTMSGGPYWNVLKGRKDGRVSKAAETINLPAPTFNVSQLIQSFSKRRLGVKDLVALSGGHTLGFSHCSSFEARLRLDGFVESFARDQGLFFREFVASMLKLGNVGVIENGESEVEMPSSKLMKVREIGAWDLNYSSFSIDIEYGQKIMGNFTRAVTYVTLPGSTYSANAYKPNPLTFTVNPSLLSFSAFEEKKSFTVKVNETEITQQQLYQTLLRHQ
ncbi:hypothetical protein Patl1_20035 [Pistacia atlantica]|uniref:Uncharacterized protein n=1 Tax=Pistacia atlantica TaxID=434234 RepID=A0ACC1BID1_9ROSI|nr:hypothetical protein Patl1_20035 [Pistacia atlantica]